MAQRIIAYIDGFNLYFGLRSRGWKRYYWLNIRALALSFLKPNQTLIKTKYFTTVVKEPADKRNRQTVYLDALQTLPDFHIFYGQFLSELVQCRHCGHTYKTYHEKMTDVNISVEVITDALQDQFDTALLISADSDLVAPINAVKQLFPQKRILAIFPPGRSSFAIKQNADAVLHIGRNELSKCVLPDPVIKANGVVLQCPKGWH